MARNSKDEFLGLLAVCKIHPKDRCPDQVQAAQAGVANAEAFQAISRRNYKEHGREQTGFYKRIIIALWIEPYPTVAAAMEKNNEDANLQSQSIAGTLFAHHGSGYGSRVNLHEREHTEDRDSDLVCFPHPFSIFPLRWGFHSSFSISSRIKDNRHSFEVDAQSSLFMQPLPVSSFSYRYPRFVFA